MSGIKVGAGIRFFVRSLIPFVISSAPAIADSSSPRLAAYYDDFMALCGDQVYEWSGADTPRKSIANVTQVGIGKSNRYALTKDGDLLTWRGGSTETAVAMNRVHSFYAGRSGLFILSENGRLWHLGTNSLLGFGEKLEETPTQVAENIRYASVGDSANYYVTQGGELYVKGRAHRGQYGDGKLASTEGYVETATNVVQVVSHTGHALILKGDGTVWGTGGNIYGPLSHHGYGDKAIRWGLIFEGAAAIATGSSHSVAIKNDGSLWIWGRNEGLTPKRVMSGVNAVAAGNQGTIALSEGKLWQWNTGAQPEPIMECEPSRND